MSSSPQTPVPQDTGSSFAKEFVLHPDHPVVAVFLLGWVFWSSITYACRSHFFHHLAHLCFSFFRLSRSAQPEAPDIEAQTSPVNEKKYRRPLSATSTVRRLSNESVLTFTLNICFAFAGFAEFASLLAYEPHGDTACAFTVAWGSMAAQAARLIGLVALVLELHSRRGSSVEFYCLCAALVIGLSFILAYTATNTGAITVVNTLGLAVCNRVPFAPTALLSSFWFIISELYVGARFLDWNGCQTSLGAFFMQSANLQIARAGSLFLLEILTIVPNAVVTNQLAQFIPFSIGALVVLSVFNRGIKDSVVVPIVKVPTPLVLSIQPSRAPTPRSIPLPTGPPPSVVDVEAPLDSSGLQPEEQELGLDSPFVPIQPRRKQHPPTLVPSSAPPRIGDASVFDAQQQRQILPFQVQYADQLERRIHTGPIVAPIRIKPQRPQVQVVIEDMEPVEFSQKSSSLIGSDIVRLHSAHSAKMRRTQSSPLDVTPSDYTNSRIWHDTPAIHTPTTVRDSMTSMPLTPGLARSVSSGSRDALSVTPSRHQSSGRKIRSPAESSAKSAWRPVPRQSYSSAKTFGGQEELPTLREGQPSGSRRASRMSSFTTKRMEVSGPYSRRSTRRSSPQPSRMGKALPLIPAPAAPPVTSPQYLTVPDHLRSPVVPDSPAGSFIRPSSQYVVVSPPWGSFGRAQGSGRLRGPRTPAASSTTPSVHSGWPAPRTSIAGPVGVSSAQRRRRSGSCPELPPLDISLAMLRSIDSPIQQ
ncbi:hypothetical protein LXA43DRAFT_994003 [Ganoderma leucocontextum]|nr:hypothetical protein LXA43DRAFT_994003 [Ganoderma leucocontextum]